MNTLSYKINRVEHSLELTNGFSLVFAEKDGDSFDDLIKYDVKDSQFNNKAIDVNRDCHELTGSDDMLVKFIGNNVVELGGVNKIEGLAFDELAYFLVYKEKGAKKKSKIQLPSDFKLVYTQYDLENRRFEFRIPKALTNELGVKTSASHHRATILNVDTVELQG